MRISNCGLLGPGTCHYRRHLRVGRLGARAQKQALTPRPLSWAPAHVVCSGLRWRPLRSSPWSLCQMLMKAFPGNPCAWKLLAPIQPPSHPMAAPGGCLGRGLLASFSSLSISQEVQPSDWASLEVGVGEEKPAGENISPARAVRSPKKDKENGQLKIAP